MLSEILLWMKTQVEAAILAGGYGGIALMMLLDAANIPIPSEIIMPFGGMLAAEGKLNVHVVALAGTAGSVVGSMINYWIGAKLGKPFLIKYGKYVLLRPKEIEHGERWFEKYGLIVTLWGRFIPLVRTFISLPAGFYRANFARFTLYAVLGCLPWNYLWTYIGFAMGKNWEKVEANMKYVDVLVILILGYFIVKFLRYRFSNKNSGEEVTPA